MKKELKLNIEKLSKDGIKVYKQIIRLEVAYSEQSEQKKEIRSLFEKAYTFLFDGKLQRAKEAVCAIIEMIRSYYDPP